MDIRSDRLRGLLALTGTAVAVAAAAVLGWVVFVDLPDTGAELAGVVFTLAGALAVGKVVAAILGSVLDDYNVAEVGVEGPIARSGGRPSPFVASVGPTADELVEQVERADEDANVDALLVRLNTPGGQVLPSDDVRRAVERFDGPTVGYATDVCASGGYWIASGCDEVWAREASLVGSVGVRGSRPNAAELADKLGISYEQFTAGKFKDAGTPLKSIDEDERAYLQRIVDDIYDLFVETVSDGRGLDPETVRATEARLFLGRAAAGRGLVDAIGAMDDVEDRLAERLSEPVEIREFAPRRGLFTRLQFGARSVACAVGIGVARALADDDAEIDLTL